MANPTSDHPIAPARLRYVSDSALRIQRVRKARIFHYLFRQRLLQDERVLKRIRSLAIPPAWKDVRICVPENGHLQAVGRDARGRKQYVDHPAWRKIRDRQKYTRVLAFGKALPRIRRQVRRDLRQPHLNKTKVLAALVRLLEASRIRVGNEEYARNNRSFGLTTLRNRHVRVRGAKMRFEYRGKSGKYHTVELRDAGLARVVARCQEIPGQELFQYFNEEGRRRKVASGDVNSYLREISGGDFTAKDFRTWMGTVLMAKALRVLKAENPEGSARKNVDLAVEAVAGCLGNTPAICRKSYVHPAVIEAYLSGAQLWPTGNGTGSRPRSGGLRQEEAAVIRLLQNHHGRNGSCARSQRAPRLQQNGAIKAARFKTAISE